MKNKVCLVIWKKKNLGEKQILAEEKPRPLPLPPSPLPLPPPPPTTYTLENKNKVWPSTTLSLPPHQKIKWHANVKLHTKSTWYRWWDKTWVACKKGNEKFL